MNTLAHLLRESNGRDRFAVIAFFTLVCLQSLFGPLDLAVYPNKMTVGLDKTVLIKLIVMAGIALVSGWALFTQPVVRRALLSPPVILISLLLLLTIAGASSGLVRISPIVSCVNYVSVIFVISAILILGFRVFAFAITCGVLVTAIWGFILFYLFPTSGVFTEPIANGEFLMRIGGLAHPNSVARSMILASILVGYLWRSGDFNWKSGTPFLLFFGWNIVLAKSRTALIAGMIGGVVLFLDWLRPKRVLLAGTLAMVVGLMVLFALFATSQEDRFVGKLIGMVAKSGEAEELTSGTGRTDIWAEAARHISMRPLLGYGLNVGPLLLVDHSQATHNSVMYATLAGGLFGGLVMIVLQLWLIVIAFRSPMLVVRAIATFLFFSCLTEDTVLETFPGPATMLWYACYVIPALPMRAVLKGSDMGRSRTERDPNA
jgi:exopolysaccharide production protein ExoQ